ncbi:MAG TPA: LysR family transcriptional regulator, partial [Pseudomonas sp.]|nr:LysR family transcriptional regulator [Pseudomonas sp.]
AKIRTWVDYLALELPRAFADYRRILQDPAHWA